MIAYEEIFDNLSDNAPKEQDVLKIVKEDILKILCESMHASALTKLSLLSRLICVRQFLVLVRKIQFYK